MAKDRCGIKFDKKVRKNGTYTVYLHIANGVQPNQIWKRKILSEDQVKKSLIVLRKANVVKKIGKAVWELSTAKLTEKELKDRCVNKFDVGKLLETAPNMVRGHAFVVRQEIPRMKNWIKRRQILKEADIPFRPVRQGVSVSVGEIEKVHLCTNSIVWYMKGMSFFGKTPEIAYNKALESLIAHIRKLENMIGIGAHNLKIRKGYKLHFSRQHYALIKNALAQKYNDEEKKLYVYDENGLWLIIDKSYNVDELEGIRNDTAKDEITFMRSYFNDLNKIRLKPSTALHLITKTQEQLQQTQGQIGLYAKEAMTHTGYIKDAGKATNKLSDEVTALSSVVKSLVEIVKNLKLQEK